MTSLLFVDYILKIFACLKISALIVKKSSKFNEQITVLFKNRDKGNRGSTTYFFVTLYEVDINLVSERNNTVHGEWAICTGSHLGRCNVCRLRQPIGQVGRRFV